MSSDYKPPFKTVLPEGPVEERAWPLTPKKQTGPTPFYIEGSDGFATGSARYNPNYPYRLLAAESLAYDDLRGKKINFAATALYLSKIQWQEKNNGMLNFRLYLTKPIHIQGEGPVKSSSVDKLDFALPFKDAPKAAFVPNVKNTPMFRDLDIEKYLTDEDGAPSFDLELILAKSEGTNSNTVIDTASKILEDKTTSAALSAIPYFGVASAVFRIIREVFFSYTGQAKEVWPSLKTTFRGKPGLGIPLKVGRYAILSTTVAMDKVVSHYFYMGGRLVNADYKEVDDADQFYLDVYAV